MIDQPTKRIHTYAAFAVALLLGSLFGSLPWHTGSTIHSLFATTASGLALFIGIVSLTMYRANKDPKTLLVIGVGFLGTSFLDGFHGIVTSSFFVEHFPSSAPTLFPWSWHASRVFLAALLCLDLLITRRSARSLVRNKTIYSLAALLTIGIFIFFAFVPLPTAYRSGWLERSLELIPGALILLALAGHLQRGEWKQHTFDHFLVLSLVTGTVMQLFVLPQSHGPFDCMFNMAQLLKISSYGLVAVGLTCAMYDLFREANDATLLSFVAKYTDNGVIICGSDHQIEWVNEGFTRITGYTSHDAIGESASVFLHGIEPDRTNVEPILERLRTQAGFDIDVLNYSKHGGEFWSHIEVRPIHDRVGKVTKFIAILRDITQRKLDEQQSKRLQRESEERSVILDAILQSASDGIVAADCEGNFLCFNKAAERILGLGALDVVRNNWPDTYGLYEPDGERLIATDDLPLVRSANGERIVDREILVKSRHGDKLVLANASPLVSNQVVIGGVTTIRDITESRQRERHLRLLRKAIDSADEAMFTISKDGHIIDVNDVACERLEYSRAELLEKTTADLDPDAGGDAWKQDRWWELKTKGTRVSESFHRTRTGRIFPVETSAIYVCYDGEEFELAFVRDISEQQRIDAENRQLTEDLLTVSRQAGMAEVATGVLHNVGNILNSVNVAAGILKQTLEDSSLPTLGKASKVVSEFEHDLSTFFASEQGTHFPRLLRELSARLERERASQLNETTELMENIEHIKEIVSMQQSYAIVRGTVERVDLGELVSKALRMNDEGLARFIETDFECESVPQVLTEKHKVLQIIVNLVSNARNAVQELDIDDRRISISVNAEGDSVRLVITDNGIGISTDNLDNIFSHGFTTRKDGHGFGLHSSTLSAQELGGSLSAQSDGLGCGATFTLRIPLIREATCRV